MSAKVTNFYIKEQDTKGTPRLVLWILAECANEEGHCFPSVATIANRCNKSERSIQRALNTLESDGKIGRKIHDGKHTKYGRTNGYYLNDYRVSIGLDPTVTFVTSKMSPVGISNTSKVSVLATRDDVNVTQTNTNTNQNNLTNTTNTTEVARLKKQITLLERELKIKNRELEIKNEELHELKVQIQKESAMHVSSPTDISAGTIENQTPKQIDNEPVRSTVCSSVKKEFINEKTDLMFPMDFHKLEDRQAAIKILITANVDKQQWQVIFDEFEGKMTWKQKRGEVVPNKLGYFYGLVQRAKQGHFNAESAKWVAEQRNKNKAKTLSLTQKTEEMAQRNVKQKPVVLDEKTLKIIEAINEIQTESELKAFQTKNYSILNTPTIHAIAKRFQEVRA
jgi:hypothetical protein